MSKHLRLSASLRDDPFIRGSLCGASGDGWPHLLHLRLTCSCLPATPPSRQELLFPRGFILPLLFCCVLSRSTQDPLVHVTYVRGVENNVFVNYSRLEHC